MPVEPVGWGEGPVVSLGNDGSVTLGSPIGPGPIWVSSPPLSAMAAIVPTTATTATIPTTTIQIRLLLWPAAVRPAVARGSGPSGRAAGVGPAAGSGRWT